jgi:hypothetical protein
MSVNKILRRILAPKEEDVRERRRKMRIEELSL